MRSGGPTLPSDAWAIGLGGGPFLVGLPAAATFFDAAMLMDQKVMFVVQQGTLATFINVLGNDQKELFQKEAKVPGKDESKGNVKGKGC